MKEMADKYEKVMVTSDYHIPYLDEKAYETMIAFAKKYKPDHFVINGDLIDFYGLSTFDKNPDRKYTVVEEITKTRQVLKNLTKRLPKKTKIYFLEGNHEARLQRYLWRNPELEGLPDLKLENLLRFKDYKINFIGVDNDYWKKDTGHLQLGNMLIMHGDSRLNGASTSKYSGYSAKNTMMNMQTNVTIGHCHRLAKIYHTTPYGDLVGMECGSLCNYTGTANWQQGFVTFELKNGKIVDATAHHINKIVGG